MLEPDFKMVYGRGGERGGEVGGGGVRVEGGGAGGWSWAQWEIYLPGWERVISGLVSGGGYRPNRY